MSNPIDYAQAVVIGLLQGVTELFPVSSLGHSVLLPAFIGGKWGQLVTDSAGSDSSKSPYLAFIVALHVATAIALLVFFRRQWVAIIRGVARSIPVSLRTRRLVADDADTRIGWLLVVGTIPVGVTGLALEHTFRTLFAKPLAAAIFLTVNGVILLAGEALRRRAAAGVTGQLTPAGSAPATGTTQPSSAGGALSGAPVEGRRQLVTMDYREAGVIGLFQTLALLAGISRSGIAMVGGLFRGLSHEDAARFSFLLATPVILAAGVLKLPSLFGDAGRHIHGQVLVGAVVAGLAAYASTRFLVRYFETRTLTPFAIYSLVAGVVCIVRFA